MGLEFQSTNMCWIPRQDTETLVEQVLAIYKGKNLASWIFAPEAAVSVSLIHPRWIFLMYTLADISLEVLSGGRKERPGIDAGEMESRQSYSGKERKSPEVKVSAGLAEEQMRREAYRVYACRERRFSFSGRRFDVTGVNRLYIPSCVIEELEPEVGDQRAAAGT